MLFYAQATWPGALCLFHACCYVSGDRQQNVAEETLQ